MGFYEKYVELCRERDLFPQSKEIRDMLGISSGAISGWKNGSLPDTEAVCKISKFFGVTTDYLLGLNLHPSSGGDYFHQDNNHGNIRNTGTMGNNNSTDNNNTYTTNNYYGEKGNKCSPCVATENTANYFLNLIDLARNMTDEQLVKVTDYAKYIVHVTPKEE